jgi:hypothetical protein
MTLISKISFLIISLELGSPSYKSREIASSYLSRLSVERTEWILPLTKSPDEEVSFRAKKEYALRKYNEFLDEKYSTKLYLKAKNREIENTSNLDCYQSFVIGNKILDFCKRDKIIFAPCYIDYNYLRSSLDEPGSGANEYWLSYLLGMIANRPE